MYKCSALNCKNSSKKDFSMHFFPKHPERRKKWIENINRPNWQPSMYSALCQVHFDSSMWVRNKKQTLKPNAIPTIFDDDSTKPNRCTKPKTKYIKKNTESDGPVSSEETIDYLPDESYENDHSYASLNNESLVLKRRIDIYEKRFVKLLQRNRYYKLKLKSCNQKLNQLETSLETLKNNDQYLGLLRIVFNEDQIEGLRRKSVRFMRWSDETLRKALKLRYACGEAGYEELLTQRIPLPSLRTLNRYTDILNTGDDVMDLKEEYET